MLVTQKSGQFEVGVHIYVNSCKYQNMGIYYTKENLIHNALHCSKIFQHTEHRATKLLHVQNTQTQIHMHLFKCLLYKETSNNCDSKHNEFRCSDAM